MLLRIDKCIFKIQWSVAQWEPEPIEEGVNLLEIGEDALVNQIKKVFNSGIVMVVVGRKEFV